MMLNWNDPKTTEWFVNASDYTGYNKKLAQMLLDRLPDRGSLCDLGCGMGLIDLELAAHFESVTGVDISESAISWLSAEAQRRGLGNIHGTVADARSLKGQWDSVITLFHGVPADFGKYLSLARDRFIAITHGSTKANFGPDEYKVRKCSDPETTAAELDKAGIKYSVEHMCLEYGQPLRSMDEARDFVTTYTKAPPETVIDDYLAEKLTETGRDDYPYYLPNQKKFAIFIMRRDKN